jgi:UDP-glucose 4-epimerase
LSPVRVVGSTGGAGYIGSHVVRQLGAAGESIITLDNLSTGFEAAVTAGELIVGDTGDAALLERIFSEHDIDTLMHFAAHTIVPESVADPLKYYGNNTASSRTLLEVASSHGVKNKISCSPPRLPFTVFRKAARHPKTRRRSRSTRTAHPNS